MKEIDLRIFNNPEFGEIRTVDVNGEPWLVGKDVARALGYTNHRKALQDHVDKDDKIYGVTIRDPIGRDQSPILINESGLYSLIFSSKLPKAREFKRWVTSEVLPSIRRTGSYGAAHTAPHVSPGGLASLIKVTRRVMTDMGSSPQEVGAMVESVLRTWNVPVPPALARQIPRQLSFEDLPVLHSQN